MLNTDVLNTVVTYYWQDARRHIPVFRLLGEGGDFEAFWPAGTSDFTPIDAGVRVYGTAWIHSHAKLSPTRERGGGYRSL